MNGMAVQVLKYLFEQSPKRLERLIVMDRIAGFHVRKVGLPDYEADDVRQQSVTNLLFDDNWLQSLFEGENRLPSVVENQNWLQDYEEAVWSRFLLCYLPTSRNFAVDIVRRRSSWNRRDKRRLVGCTHTDSAEEEATMRELEEILKAAIGDLPKQLGLIFVMALGGYTYKEIANHLRIGEGTVKSQVCKARMKLRMHPYFNHLE